FRWKPQTGLSAGCGSSPKKAGIMREVWMRGSSAGGMRTTPATKPPTSDTDRRSDLPRVCPSYGALVLLILLAQPNIMPTGTYTIDTGSGRAMLGRGSDSLKRRVAAHENP